MTGPKVLTLDIETSPIKKYSWGLRNDFGNIGEIIEDPEILCIGAKFTDERAYYEWSEWGVGRRAMLEEVASLLDQADVLQGWNSKAFDYKWINGELLKEGIPLPSPVKHLDLMRVTQKYVRLPSYKLEYVARQLVGAGKMDTGGFGLWRAVDRGDEKARAKMLRYMKRDVLLTERVGKRLAGLPNTIPHFGLYGGPIDGCPHCGSEKVQKRGFAYTPQSKFQQYQCMTCNRWYRGTKALERASTAKVA